MKKTALYMIDYEYHSNSSFAFDEMHRTAIVEAPENVTIQKLRNLCYAKIPGCFTVNSYRRVDVIKLV